MVTIIINFHCVHITLNPNLDDSQSVDQSLTGILSVGSISLLLLILCVVFMLVIVVLFRSRAKIQSELQQARENIKEYTTVNYEEIATNVFTTENVAYGNMHSKFWLAIKVMIL